MNKPAMDTYQYLPQLKVKLQSLGPLRPEAWVQITEKMQVDVVYPEERFIRKLGSTAYIATGLLKEYDPTERKQPSIVNFIAHNQSLVTRKHNRSHYLVAEMPTVVYFWDFEDLQHLYHQFAELKQIYDEFCAAYDEQCGYRQRILEEHLLIQRIILFKKYHHNILNSIKRKDMANYLKVNYNYFVHNWSTNL